MTLTSFPETELIDAPQSIDPRLVQFARLLRDNGFNVGQSNVADTLRILSEDGALNQRRFRQTLQVLLCSQRSELERFDDLFEAYWLGHVGRKRTLLRHMSGGSQSIVSTGDAGASGAPSGLARYFEWRDANEAGQEDAEDPEKEETGDAKMSGASPHSSRSGVDVGKVSDPEEFERLMAFAERLGRRLRYRISRRRKAQARGRELHMRRTLRRCVETGGVPMTLIRKGRKTPPVSLLLFVDVSGSMDSYSVFFTRFMHALVGGFARAEAFLFHTRLVHITKALHEANPLVMMQKMSLISQGWSGGTKIGEALATFNAQYGRQFSGSRTIAIIMSDGFDTGPSEVLESELKKLKSRCHRVIWLNPLMGREGYEPSAMGAQAVLKHVDVAAPAHNLRSLLVLEDLLVNA